MTNKQEQVFTFIKNYRSAGNGSPTYREMAEAFKCSIGTIQCYLGYLEREGLVTILPNKSRGIRINQLERIENAA